MGTITESFVLVTNTEYFWICFSQNAVIFQPFRIVTKLLLMLVVCRSPNCSHL
jgi:hypothetical protein